VKTHLKCTLPAHETYLQALLVELFVVRVLCIVNLMLAAKGDLSPGASEAIRLFLTPLANATQTVVLYTLWLRSEMLRKLVSLLDYSIGDVVI
jgi:glycerol uptake facilitator-like aquaporin